MPSECPLCGMKTNIEFSDPGQDAPCPICGHLLWSSTQLVRAITQRYAEVLGTRTGAIDTNASFSDLGADSLDTVEMVMELSEEFDVDIPDEDVENIQSVNEFVRYIQDQRRGKRD